MTACTYSWNFPYQNTGEHLWVLQYLHLLISDDVNLLKLNEPYSTIHRQAQKFNYFWRTFIFNISTFIFNRRFSLYFSFSIWIQKTKYLAQWPIYKEICWLLWIYVQNTVVKGSSLTWWSMRVSVIPMMLRTHTIEEQQTKKSRPGRSKCTKAAAAAGKKKDNENSVSSWLKYNMHLNTKGETSRDFAVQESRSNKTDKYTNKEASIRSHCRTWLVNSNCPSC